MLKFDESYCKRTLHYKSACITYLGLMMIPEPTALMTLQKKYFFAWDAFFSHNNLGYLKQKVFLKRTWAWLHLCFYDIFLLVLWRKGLVQMFVVFWLVFTKLWSLKAFFESDTTPTNTQHISPLVFFAYFC